MAKIRYMATKIKLNAKGKPIYKRGGGKVVDIVKDTAEIPGFVWGAEGNTEKIMKIIREKHPGFILEAYIELDETGQPITMPKWK